MAKKHTRTTRKVHKASKPVRRVEKKAPRDIFTVIRGWFFVVAFALMLGIGAIVGTYFNKLISETPSVAGAAIERVR